MLDKDVVSEYTVTHKAQLFSIEMDADIRIIKQRTTINVTACFYLYQLLLVIIFLRRLAGKHLKS
jgi:hypothetical protein